IKALRILLAIAAFYDYEIWHMDINTAFLNGPQSEDMDNSKRGSTPMQEKPDYRKSQAKPGDIHWIVVKTNIKYMRNTKDMVPIYREKPKSELKVTCYVDAGFQTAKDDTKS
nr:retrotransposon protein putative Ty1-copia subclass [Tanacetum cinerariifolium]GFC05445.1 retrotransposon protein putative Ty1-copia subclass [Tanacetum cinerariifolium]